MGHARIQSTQATECDSINDELSSKFRFLGSWDENGRPDYLESPPDTVSEELINYVTQTLPETVSITESNGKYFGDDILKPLEKAYDYVKRTGENASIVIKNRLDSMNGMTTVVEVVAESNPYEILSRHEIPTTFNSTDRMILDDGQ